MPSSCSFFEDHQKAEGGKEENIEILFQVIAVHGFGAFVSMILMLEKATQR